MARKSQTNYLVAGRLADVLALIQVLALDPNAHRSEDGLRSELQGPPRSAETWADLANAHPEFFRVASTGEHRVSLVARHVASRDDSRLRGPIPPDYASELLRLAVEMHDREIRRSQRWHVWVPLMATVATGVFTLLGIWMGSHLGSP